MHLHQGWRRLLCCHGGDNELLHSLGREGPRHRAAEALGGGGCAFRVRWRREGGGEGGARRAAPRLHHPGSRHRYSGA